jgi:hypothetical protein
LGLQEQFFDPPSHRRIAGTSLVPPAPRGQSPGCAKDSQLALEGFFHGLDLILYKTSAKNPPKAEQVPCYRN